MPWSRMICHGRRSGRRRRRKRTRWAAVGPSRHRSYRAGASQYDESSSNPSIWSSFASTASRRVLKPSHRAFSPASAARSASVDASRVPRRFPTSLISTYSTMMEAWTSSMRASTASPVTVLITAHSNASVPAGTTVVALRRARSFLEKVTANRLQRVSGGGD